MDRVFNIIIRVENTNITLTVLFPLMRDRIDKKEVIQ